MIKTISQIQYLKRRSVEILSTRRSVATTANQSNRIICKYESGLFSRIHHAGRPTMDHHTQGIRQNIDTNRMDFTINVFVTL